MAYNIRLVKLINGDMVLGKIDDDEGKIKGPAIVQMMPTQQGGVQMAARRPGQAYHGDAVAAFDRDEVRKGMIQ